MRVHFVDLFLQAEELRQRVRELEERERREGKKMADEEALRKIRSVEEQIDILNKKLSLAKQVQLWLYIVLTLNLCLLSVRLTVKNVKHCAETSDENSESLFPSGGGRAAK